MTDNVETMAYAANDAPPWWSQNGTDPRATAVDGAQTSEAMIIASRLNWQVELRPMTYMSGTHNDGTPPTQLTVPGYTAIVRTHDDMHLGVAGKRYVPIQNEHIFDFMDSLVSDDVMRYVTAGSINHGKRVWIMAQMLEGWRVGDDLYETYISATTRHDSYGALQMHIHARRIVCENTLDASLREGKHLLHVTHSGDVAGKLQTARQIATITTETQRRYQTWLESAAAVTVTQPIFDAVSEGMFGTLDDTTGKQRRDAIAAFQRIYDEEAATHDPTVYSLHNAVTGYYSHSIKTRKADRPMAGILGGDAAKLKINALDILAQASSLPTLSLVA